ncbi:MAG: twin-arginine translocase TatA/TatE family subunit [Planctomycetes bacterium]|jgi:sec-independent protein translocase protein TatA|nr:twin-arginine translocase TatA/TatE family subunit [Planctomycetota bacterium]
MDMLAFFNFTTTEIIIFCVVALVLFGGSLPMIAKNLGKSVVEFKKGVKDVKDDLDNVGNEDKKLENKPSREVTVERSEAHEHAAK